MIGSISCAAIRCAPDFGRAYARPARGAARSAAPAAPIWSAWRRVSFVSIAELPSLSQARLGGSEAGPPRLAQPLALGAEAGIEDVPPAVSQQVEAEHEQHHPAG